MLMTQYDSVVIRAGTALTHLEILISSIICGAYLHLSGTNSKPFSPWGFSRFLHLKPSPVHVWNTMTSVQQFTLKLFHELPDGVVIFVHVS